MATKTAITMADDLKMVEKFTEDPTTLWTCVLYCIEVKVK
jgi:hypothetical protein